MANPEHRISEAALLMGYTMSRLDRGVLGLMGCDTLEAAFVKAGLMLGEKPKTIKLLRDEFDPFTSSKRRGFVNRPPRPPIAALVYEMQSVSDGALEAMVLDALGGKQTALEAIREIVTEKPDRLASVAERLQTGAVAERYFAEHCEGLVKVPFADLHDARLDACGYDFAVRRDGQPVFEVKGLTGSSGGLLFTDLEWQTARRLGPAYWLVVVQDVASEPTASVLINPAASLPAQIVVEQRTVVSWRSPFPIS